jgi:hypothetical protein
MPMNGFRYLFRAMVIVCFLNSAEIAAASSPTPSNACRRHSSQDPSVPECPANGSGVLPDSYPAMAVAVSDQLGGSRWVREFVGAVLEAQPDKPPQFILNVSPATYEDVRKMISDMPNLSEERRRLWLSALSRTQGAAPFNWLQDIGQSFFSGGRPQWRPISSYQRGRGTNASISEILERECGVNMGPGLGRPENSRSGKAGGNIEGGPGGLCLVGNDAFEGNEWAEFSLDVCGGAEPFEAPTSFLEVGHTDEIFSTIRTGPGRCDVAILLASPLAAIMAMRSRPDGVALEAFHASDRDELASSKFLRHYIGLCDALRLSHLQRADSTPGGSTPRRSVASAEPPKSMSLSPLQSNSGAYFDCEDALRRMTNSDLMRIYDTDPNLRAVNMESQRIMHGFRRDLQARLGSDGCPAPRIVDMPTLFQGYAMDRGTDRFEVSGASGIFPNPTNLQQFGDTIMMSDPQNAGLRADIESRIRELNPRVKVRFINTQFAHVQGGNLHCSTNAIRYCRQPSRAVRR